MGAPLGQGTSRSSEVDPCPPPDLPRPGSQRVPGVEAVLHIGRCILVRTGWIGADEAGRHCVSVRRWHGGREPCTRRAASHLTAPGGRHTRHRWRVQADLAEMARDGRLRAGTWLPWQQGGRGDAPPARELSPHRVSHGLTHTVSSSRPPGRALRAASSPSAAHGGPLLLPWKVEAHQRG